MTLVPLRRYEFPHKINFEKWCFYQNTNIENEARELTENLDIQHLILSMNEWDQVLETIWKSRRKYGNNL